MTAFTGPAAWADQAGARSHKNRNSLLISHAAKVHIPEGALVADVTWGRGNFWRGVHRHFVVLSSDAAPVPGARVQADFRWLPYRDACLDVVVLDPPYLPESGHTKLNMNVQYRNSELNQRLGTRAANWNDIMALYGHGIAEAARVLKDEGQLWVKGMNTVRNKKLSDSKGCLTDMARAWGLEVADCFELAGRPGGMQIRGGQKHGEPQPSFLLVAVKRG